MEKNLSARLLKNAMLREQSKKTSNKASFLVLKHDIEGSILDGWSMKSIWALLFKEQKLNCSYKTFRRYVIQFIQPKENTIDKKKSEAIPSFKYNPIPNPEELF